MTESPREIVERARGDLSVLAVDRNGAFGGAFRFGVFAGEEWYSEALYSRRTPTGWEEMGSGGSRGTGWETPWKPPPDGWDGDDLYVLGSAGLDVDDDHDSAIELKVIYGFASPVVVAIEITGPTSARAVDITSPVGAFAAVVIGNGEFAVTALSARGETSSRRTLSLSAYRS